MNLANFGPISLVILQPTSFCNLDCDYCYLPNRNLQAQLSLDVIEPIFEKIFTSPFCRGNFTVCWHAGEPLAVPVSFYEQAFRKIASASQQFNLHGYQIKHSLQTNGTLINQQWCDLFKKHQIHVGISLDGPAFIHDSHRRNRRGQGSHAQTMKGINYLQNNQIPFQIIAVITKDSLNYPEEMFQFFLDNQIYDLGFNIEEIEGINQSSSLNSELPEKFRHFLTRFWQLIAEHEGKVKLREFENICYLIYRGERIVRRGLLMPFVILNIDNRGNFSTFDPELLSMKTTEYGDFILGNIQTDTLASICTTEKFQKIYQDITLGWELCKETCEYFGLCGGGAGSNKYWENGTFASAETLACRYYEQIVADVVIAQLETALGLQSSPPLGERGGKKLGFFLNIDK